MEIWDLPEFSSRRFERRDDPWDERMAPNRTTIFVGRTALRMRDDTKNGRVGDYIFLSVNDTRFFVSIVKFYLMGPRFTRNDVMFEK